MSLRWPFGPKCRSPCTLTGIVRSPGWTTFLPIRFGPAIHLRGLQGWRGPRRSLQRPLLLIGRRDRWQPDVVVTGWPMGEMLKTGDLVSHFAVTTLGGQRFAYSDIWQRKNLLLVLLSHAESAGNADYVSQLTEQLSYLTADDTACVVTRDSISGLPTPAVVVADRWGEIHHVAHAARIEDLTPPAELVEWCRFVQRQCPECEGEAK